MRTWVLFQFALVSLFAVLMQSTFWLLELSPMDAGFFRGDRIRRMDRISRTLLSRPADIQIALNRDYSLASASGIDGAECENLRGEMKRLRMERCKSEKVGGVVQWLYRNPAVGFLSLLEFRESAPTGEVVREAEKRYLKYVPFPEAAMTNWYFGWVVQK